MNYPVPLSQDPGVKQMGKQMVTYHCCSVVLQVFASRYTDKNITFIYFFC